MKGNEKFVFGVCGTGVFNIISLFSSGKKITMKHMSTMSLSLHGNVQN